MKIIILTKEQFDNYANNHKYKNFYQTSQYGTLMKKKGFNDFYLGLIDDNNNIMAATLILEKKILNFFKVGYSPRGFLIDFYNKELVYIFTKYLKKYLFNLGFIYIKLDPPVLYLERDKDGSPIAGGINNQDILYFLKKLDYEHQGFNNNFNRLLPRWNVVTKLNPSSQVLFSSFSKQTKNKIRKSYRRGITIYKGTKNELKLFYSFLDKSISERIDYYMSYYDIFKEKDMIELYFAKLNPSTFIQTSNKLFENEHKRNAHLTNLVQENTKSKAVNRYISLKMNSDKLLNNYKQDIISANSIFGSYPNGVIVAASLIIKYNNEIFFLAEGYNKEFKRFCANHLMKWVIINEYAKKGYSIANHNGISGYFKSNKPYYGLYKYKIGFNGDIFEYIGEFNLVINKYLYFFINKFNFIEKNKK